MDEMEQSIRVLHVTFNMGFGGTEQVIRQLVQHLPVDQYRNEIVCIDGFVGEIGQSLQSEGLLIHVLKRGGGLDWALIAGLRRIIRERRIDVVHCHQYTPYVYGWLASLGLRARVVFTEHGRFHPDRYRYKARWINPLIARMTPVMVAISRATKEALIQYEFMPGSRIEVIYNGIEGFQPDNERARVLRQELGIGESDFLLGTVSRLDPVKNQRMMLDAFSSFHDQQSNAWLLIVGDGPDRPMLEDYAYQLGISDRVLFLGFQAEPSAYLQAMDVFLLSSHTEGTSMTLLEAMSLGVPPVVTRVGGSPEIVKDHENGLLVPTGDASAMARAIGELADDEPFRRALSREARAAFCRDFSVDVMSHSYSLCYQRCVEH